jgi:hypothetical protein
MALCFTSQAVRYNVRKLNNPERKINAWAERSFGQE